MDTRYTFIRETPKDCFRGEPQFVTFHFYQELDGEMGRTRDNMGGHPGISTLSPKEFAQMLPEALALVHPVNFDNYFEEHKNDKDFDVFDPKCKSFTIEFDSHHPFDHYAITLPRYYDGYEIYYDAYREILKLLDLGELAMSLHKFAPIMRNTAKTLEPEK